MSPLHDEWTFVISHAWKEKTANLFTVRSQFCFKHMCDSVKRKEKCQRINSGDLLWWNSGYFYFLLRSFFQFPIISAINMWLYSKKKKKSIIFMASTSIYTVLPWLCENIFTYIFIKSQTQLSDWTTTSKKRIKKVSALWDSEMSHFYLYSPRFSKFPRVWLFCYLVRQDRKRRKTAKLSKMKT